MSKKIYVVTGGGSGMGLAIAKEMGKNEDAVVVICGRTLSKLENALVQLKEAGVDARASACDMSNLEDVTKLAEFANSLGEMKCLVNAAGVSASMGSLEKVIEINLYSVVNAMKVFKPYMGKGSSIINIGSCTAYMYPLEPEVYEIIKRCDQENVVKELVPYAHDSDDLAYGISKVGLVNYTKSKCLEFMAQGCRTLSVSPGAVLTEVMEKELEKAKDFIASIPAGRVGQPEDIAYLCDFLASDKAEYITGIDVVIDGGSLALIASYANQN